MPKSKCNGGDDSQSGAIGRERGAILWHIGRSLGAAEWRTWPRYLEACAGEVEHRKEEGRDAADDDRQAERVADVVDSVVQRQPGAQHGQQPA